MTRLCATDLEAVLSFLEEAQAVEQSVPFSPELLDRLAQIVGCEMASFFEVDHPRRILHQHISCSSGTIWNGTQDVWRCPRTLRLQRHKRANGAGPVQLSDIFNRRQRIDRDFNPNFRDDGMVDDLHVDLDPARQWKSELVLFSSRDFRPRERLMLQVLRPHLASVYRALKLRRRLATITANIGADEAKGLTPREREVMLCVGDGSSNAEIARTLVVEPSTVRKHLEHIYAKLGVGNRTAALAKLRA